MANGTSVPSFILSMQWWRVRCIVYVTWFICEAFECECWVCAICHVFDYCHVYKVPNWVKPVKCMLKTCDSNRKWPNSHWMRLNIHWDLKWTQTQKREIERKNTSNKQQTKRIISRRRIKPHTTTPETSALCVQIYKWH